MSTSTASAVSIPSAVGADRDVDPHGCRHGAIVNWSARVNSYCTGRPVRSTASATRSSISISCLPPNPPPTRRGEHAHLVAVEAEHVAQLVADQERHLGAGAEHQPAVLVEPAACTRGSPGARAARVASCHVPCTTAPPRPAPPRARRRCRRLRRAPRRRGCGTGRRSGSRRPCRRAAAARRAACQLGVEHRWQHLVLDLDRAAGLLGDARRCRRRRRRPAARGTARSCRARRCRRDRRCGSRGGRWRRRRRDCRGGSAPRARRAAPRRAVVSIATIRACACGLPQHAMCSRPVGGEVQRVLLGAASPPAVAAGAPNGAAERLTGTVSIRCCTAPPSASRDRAIAGAAAQIALQRLRQVGAVARSRASDAVMTMPAVQNPHWKPAASTNGAASGCRSSGCRGRRRW